jgi:hypothetical protein
VPVSDPGCGSVSLRRPGGLTFCPECRLSPRGAGAASGSPTTNIVITGNRFGQNYYAKSGQYGPVAYFDPAGKGNTWTGNIWDTTGHAVPSS